jgi:hypothetical protein
LDSPFADALRPALLRRFDIAMLVKCIDKALFLLYTEMGRRVPVLIILTGIIIDSKDSIPENHTRIPPLPNVLLVKRTAAVRSIDCRHTG